MKIRLAREYFPQILVLIFIVVMMFAAVYLHIPIPQLVNDSLVRLIMNGVLVLSLLPMLRTGMGINYGLPVGVLAGLLAICLIVNYKVVGIGGFFASVTLAGLIGAIFGLVYANILKRVPGREETAGIFCGYSSVYAMSFFWAVAPFKNPEMLWPIGGYGLRPTIGLSNYFAKALNVLWAFNIGDFLIPVGGILFLFGLGGLLHFFFKTRTGLGFIAVGENPDFARLSGIDLKRTRTHATMLSTAMAAIGICTYAQGYGFVELYEAPLMMAFPAASAILLGGTTAGRAGIATAIVGTFLFQSVYVVSGPLANTILVPELSEIVRVILSSSIILYAILNERGGRHKFDQS